MFSGQQDVTASSVALPTNSVTNSVVVKAMASNVINIFVGPSGVATTTGYELQPGQASPPLSVGNANEIFLIASTTGAKICFIGT